MTARNRGSCCRRARALKRTRTPSAWVPALPTNHALRARARTHTQTHARARAHTHTQEEERRQRSLAPYLVAAPKRGVIGRSKYAERLRKQVRWRLRG